MNCTMGREIQLDAMPIMLPEVQEPTQSYDTLVKNLKAEANKQLLKIGLISAGTIAAIFILKR